MRADNKVSVVIPNYNGKRFLAACLKALLSDAPEAELLVVDNGSADGSRELVEREFPGVRLIALVLLVMTGFFPLGLIYLVAGLIMPDAKSKGGKHVVEGEFKEHK